MSQIRTITQKRSVSAKVYKERMSTSPVDKNKKNRGGRVYTQSFEPIFQVKPSKSRLHTSTAEYTYKNVQKGVKQPQELVQQNFHLKNELNDLNNKLYLTRFKIQTQKKKNVIYAKKLNRQFQKQLYWPNQKHNDYLITGIKHQYEKLKQRYEQKCEELTIIKKTISSTQIQQASAYCEALQTQNKILIQNITYLKKNRSNAGSLISQDFNSSSSPHQKIIQSVLLQQKRKINRYKNQIQHLEQKLIKQATNQKQLEKKVNFLQKLIIQKENQAHHINKKVKTIEKQKSKLLHQISNFQQKISLLETKSKEDLQQLKTNNQKQAHLQKVMYEKIIKQKNGLIQKLEKQIGYLSTLLSYWKPLDEMDKFDSTSQKQKTISINNNSASFNTGNRQGQSRSRTPGNSLFIDQGQNQQSGKGIRNSNTEQFNLKNDISLLTIYNPDSELNQSANRQARRSTKKWNKQAQKCRKVGISQVQYLGELVRFKMIANKVSLADVKQIFSYKGQKPTVSKLQEQLISMKQIKQILQAHPFSLSSQQAFLFSRYIIEDEGADYVYCHDGNQLERSIVKSIIKTVIGDYVLPDVIKSEQKWKQIKKIYSHNLQLALKSICPKGTISKDKFLQLIHSLGIEMDDQTKNYLIGNLISTQKSLEFLKYDNLFNNEQKIQ